MRSPLKVAIPRSAAPSECPMCFEEAVKNNQCRKCGVWIPSKLTYIDPQRSPFRRKTEYTPRFDGITAYQQTRDDPHDELAEYREELDALEVETDHDGDAGYDDPPTVEEVESLPW